MKKSMGKRFINILSCCMALCVFNFGSISANAASIECRADSVYSIRAAQAEEYINSEYDDFIEQPGDEEIAPAFVFSANPGSVCVGSACAGSTCLGSACAGSICIISGCLGSVCALCTK